MNEKCILNPEIECLGLMKAKELSNDLGELRRQNSATHERLFDRITEIERQVGIQGERYANILEKITQVVTKMDSIALQVREIEGKPGKRWESLIGCIISAVAAAVCGVLLGRFAI